VAERERSADGQLSFDDFLWAEHETARDEQVRGAADAPVADGGPGAVRADPGPRGVLHEIGADLEERIDALARATAGPERPGEEYLEKVARLTSARVNAESDLIREAMIPEPGEDIEEPLPPEWRSIWTHDPEYETDPD
jgi:hypothetical protein